MPAQRKFVRTFLITAPVLTASSKPWSDASHDSPGSGWNSRRFDPSIRSPVTRPPSRRNERALQRQNPIAHVVSNATHPLFSYSPKRGDEGIKPSQVITEFSGNLFHDFSGAYDVLECTHSRCNDHLLRELTACIEDGHPWAENVITALLAMKQTADQARAKDEKMIDPAHRARLQKPDDHWVAIDLQAHPEQHKSPNKQGILGRVKQST